MQTADEFDPLVDLHGLWTLDLAERYLPIDGVPPAKYECLDGRLIMTPRGSSTVSHAIGQLCVRLLKMEDQASRTVCSRLTIALCVQRWIESDMVVLRAPIKRDKWISAEDVVMPIEFARPIERIDRPRLCAEAGVPYYLRIEVSDDEAFVKLLRLDERGAYRVHAKALAGQEFRTELPFAMSFDPANLLLTDEGD